MSATHPTSATLTGLGFPESLRWHGGALWFSDMFRGRVLRWEPGSSPESVLDAAGGGPAMPGGLGWLPDGRLLVVDCLERRVLAVSAREPIATHADLADRTRHPLNDLHADRDGTVWVGGYGFDPDVDPPVASPLYRIDPAGRVTPTAAEFVFPNGTERSARGLIVAETFADRLSTLADDGARRTSVELPDGSGPDGLSVAPDGAVWVALAFAGRLVRVGLGGSFDTVDVESGGSRARGVFDCAVHPSGRLIAVATADADESYAAGHDTGWVSLLTIG